MDNNTLLGECCARLGRTDEARAHFESVILLARSTGAFFYEMLAHRNYIVHVLDAEGGRDNHLAELGGAIVKLVLDGTDYPMMLEGKVRSYADGAVFSTTLKELTWGPHVSQFVATRCAGSQHAAALKSSSAKKSRRHAGDTPATRRRLTPRPPPASRATKRYGS